MKLCLFLVVFALVGVGCGYTANTREKVHERNIVTGTVAAMPIELRHDRIVERQESVEGTRDTGLESLVGAVGAAASGGGSILTGGLGGLALGLAGMGFAWWKKRQAETAMTQTVRGLEEAKEALPPDAVEVLHSNLSKSMDTTTKARVKRAKASIT